MNSNSTENKSLTTQQDKHFLRKDLACASKALQFSSLKNIKNPYLIQAAIVHYICTTNSRNLVDSFFLRHSEICCSCRENPSCSCKLDPVTTTCKTTTSITQKLICNCSANNGEKLGLNIKIFVERLAECRVDFREPKNGLFVIHFRFKTDLSLRKEEVRLPTREETDGTPFCTAARSISDLAENTTKIYYIGPFFLHVQV